MKFCILLFFITTIAACTDSSQPGNQNDADSTAVKKNPVTECYLYTQNKDSIRLQITITNTSVSGELVYNFRGKDLNQGVLQGEMRGDTLLADYEFQSEGVVSIREVAFLKKGDDFAEGYGEAEEKDGKMLFKNIAELTYSNTVILKKINCSK